ncbi:hypothetical protein BG011_004626 [Mortierella polycephala]|uniref:Uncharacterized protein n=1 Tax=Mortierella polycephala TaxID=41804 RepID=A0A9P6U2G4_9FUNG|nr:hypothetical protein BG011_004626 [Mortierella polycephala]
MKFSLKAVALSALLSSFVIAAPVAVEKRDANSDRIAACFVGLIFTGSWPGSCKAAVAVNLGLIRSITVNQMTMDFSPADPWAPTTSSNSIVATMLSIPGITLPIDSVRQHIILADNDVQIGSIDTPWSAASVKGGALTTSFSTSTLNVFPASHGAFSNFISSLNTKASHPVTLQGAVDIKLNLGIFGKLTIPGVGFKATTTFAGLNNLTPINYLFLIDTNFDNIGFITLTTIVNIVNPSMLTLKLGDVAFDTAASEGRVGISTIKDLNLVPGDNYVLSTTDLDMALPAAGAFLGNLGNADGVLTLTGYEGSSSDVALNAGLAAMKSVLVVPQNFEGSVMSQAPYKDWSLKTLPSTNTDFVVEVTATFQSPYYGFPIEMVHALDAGMDNYVTVSNVSPTTNMMRLFNFMDTLTFSVSGTGSVTVTFKGKLASVVPAAKNRWTELVAYAAANGHIPIEFTWMANIIVNNDGINRYVDWGNTGTGLGNVNIAVGADFASILNAIP